jgi:2-amino-4-hydroxy-6-hydroxymethyldihydropteridine diphosphokinase
MSIKVYFSIGSNQEDREFNIEDALGRIVENIGNVNRTSSFYETEPWGFQSREQFLNIVAEADTDLNPADLMDTITKIENRMGRIRDKVRYTSRIIDIDILLYEDVIVNDVNLRIPHQLMHERNFVLIPMNEIAPDLVHPVNGKTISELLEVCSDKSGIKKLENAPKIGARP